MDMYDREVNAINYLRKIGKLWFKNVSMNEIVVYGDQMLWSSGGDFKSTTDFYTICLRERKVKKHTDIKKLV